MLRNVLRKLLCHQRLRLASLTFLTALIVASYLLVFLHLESLVQMKDSGFHSLGERVDEVPSFCGNDLLDNNAWKETVSSVLTDLTKSERSDIENVFVSLRNPKKFVDGLKVVGPKNIRKGFHVDGESGFDAQKVEDMIYNFQEVLNRICLLYTNRRVIDSIKSNIGKDELRPDSDKNYIEDTETDNLRNLIEEMSLVRKEVFGIQDENLKKMKASTRWYLNIHRDDSGHAPAWKTFQNHISQLSLYEDEEDSIPWVMGIQPGPSGRRGSKLVDRLMKDLSTLGITSVDEVSGLGTQLKYIFNLQDGSRALFKPMRVPRDAEESLDTYYMYEKERHTSEIAAFHLDRIIGFNRVPPAAGRLIDMISDLQVFLAPHSKKKFYFSPVGNQCFFGKCLYYCDPAHGVCGQGRMLEGSFVAFLPNKSVADWSSIKNPWIRSYSKHNRSFWERESNGNDVCFMMRSQPPFNEWPSLLNVIDIHIFDFLIGNKDRHHFHFFNKFNNNSNFVLIDNGKGFGRHSHDIVDILAPLYQCCMIRYTTLKRLFAFHSNPEERLSLLMKQSLSTDVLPDILTPAHLRALDRRVRIILQQVIKCIAEVGNPTKVVLDDDFIHQLKREAT